MDRSKTFRDLMKMRLFGKAPREHSGLGSSVIFGDEYEIEYECEHEIVFSTEYQTILRHI
jgi:hypothetical protein